MLLFNQGQVTLKDKKKVNHFIEELHQEIFSKLPSDFLKVETYFQPIVQVPSFQIIGFEAFSRPLDGRNILELLRLARNQNFLSEFDLYCRLKAIMKAYEEGISPKELLFINVHPWVLESKKHPQGITLEFIKLLNLSPRQIVLEITEYERPTDNESYLKTVFYYANQGFRISLDDFGTGCMGYRSLLEIEPDFVKLDGYFTRALMDDNLSYSFVKHIVEICQAIGSKVIAEGVEEERAIAPLLDLNIEFLQGYYFYKPTPYLRRGIMRSMKVINHEKSSKPLLIKASNVFEEEVTSGEIHDIAIFVPPVNHNTPVLDIFNIFMSNPEIFTLPVVTDELKPIGALHRFEFFERIILGRYGYGISLNSRKQAYEVMRKDIIIIEGDLSLEEAGAIVSSRYSQEYQLDLIVTQKEIYQGILPIKVLLYYLSEKTLRLAKETNPLTGLPGNWAIRREIERRLKNKENFEVIYIDLNDFKPYNDHYGFEAGDEVIKSLGEILIRLASRYPDAWVGHIGGDDFVALVKSEYGEGFCAELCQAFEKQRDRFHREEDLQRNYFESVDRQGERRIFNLLTLSCAIIPSNCFSSFGELSSRATELKNYVKKISKETGKSLFMRERRTPQNFIMPEGEKV